MKFTFPPESKPLDGFTIKRAIHRGGFGEVYYALTDAGKEVALKLLRDNMEVELRGISQCMNLKHPNLVTIFDIKTDDDGDHWLVMEYVSGKTLDQVIADNPHGMPMEEVRRWLSGMAAGLGFLHDRGIVHRDLKPANVYNEAGVVKVGDVGLAKYISESRRNAQTESVGTVYYMAPEVAHGRYGREVDTYSLGIVLYEMLTGRVPFDGESTAEILMKHLSEKPDLRPIPERLRPVVARALEKDPLRRTPSVAEVESEFHRALRGEELPHDIPEESFTSTQPPPLPKSFLEHPKVRPHMQATLNEVYAAKRAWKQMKEDAKARRREEKRAARRAWKQMKHDARARHPHGHWHGSQNFVAASQVTQNANDGWYTHLHVWLRIAAVVIVLVALFRPGALPGLMQALFMGGCVAAVSYGMFRVARFVLGPPTYASTGTAGMAHAASPIFAPTAGPRQEPPSAPRAAQRRVYYGPETPRLVSMRQRMTELTGSLTSAVLCSAVITIGLAVLTSMLPTVELAATFGLTTLLGSWAVLGLSKLNEGTGSEAGGRRFTLLLAGVAVGLVAFWVQSILFVPVPAGGLLPAIFGHVGQFDLRVSGQPTAVAYAIFFGGLLALRRWWWHADAFRSKRFRISSVLMTVLVAYLMSAVWAFPQVWGMTLAAAISSVVQLSAVWVPQEERAGRIQGETHVV